LEKSVHPVITYSHRWQIDSPQPDSPQTDTPTHTGIPSAPLLPAYGQKKRGINDSKNAHDNFNLSLVKKNDANFGL